MGSGPLGFGVLDTRAWAHASTRVPADAQLTQAIRLADVFIIGPAMVIGGGMLSAPLGAFLVAAGVATIAYNGINYLAWRRS